MTSSDTAPKQETLFPIGTVARMTGISKDTIRAWERRYAAVTPKRTSGGGRLYSRNDIARLALIKRLTDEGERAGHLCKLSTEELNGRIELHAQHQLDTKSAVTSAPRVVVLGGGLMAKLAPDDQSLPGIEILALHHNPEALVEAPALRPDVLVVEFPTVDESSPAELAQLMTECAAERALVVYGFGTRRAVRLLETQTSTPVRAPVGLAELRKLILAGTPRVAASSAVSFRAAADEDRATTSVPERRFNDAALMSLAADATPVQCECPHHLVDLIRSLLAFETYSRNCENRGDDDAAVHGFLHSVTAEARALLETGLAEVAKHDGLPTP
jgi:hypothetical protein